METVVEKVQFEGIIEEQKYYSDSSHWGVFYMTVISVDVGDLQNGMLVSVKGIIHSPELGKRYQIKGEIEYSTTFGDTIVITESKPIYEISSNDYRGQRYILTKLFPKFVKNMYKALENPYETLKNKDYEKLMTVYGCGFSRAVQWADEFAKTLPKHKAYIELARYSISDNLMEKIIEGCNNDLDKAVDLVKNHPYELMRFKSVGWKTADNIALQNGMSPFALERVEMCIYVYLKEQASNGKSYSKSEDIMDALINCIGEDIPDLVIAEALHSLKDKNLIFWNKEKTKIGLIAFYELEHKIAEHLMRLKNSPNNFEYSNWKKIITEKEKQQGWNYTEQQMKGIQMVLENQVCCISGYGGTGKTSIIDGILSVLKNYSSMTVALAGRAASRISETTNEESKTIHKLLGMTYSNNKSAYNYEYEPLEYDILVIDEMSMIDGRLYLEILKSCASGTKVIFIGDVGQLESIGSCAVAADMLDSSWIPSIFLDKIHRQAQKSAIITESIKIRKGKQIITKDWSGEETRGELQDLILNCYTDKSNTYHNIVNYFKKELSTGKSILDIQIIVPSKQGVSSVSSLNNAAQKIYNPKSKKTYQVKQGSNEWILKEGDKVINKMNKYDIKNSNGDRKDIFNGNLGIVKKIVPEYILIDFIGIGLVEVPYNHARYIELGYAITCHSAQGSQFPVVIGGIDYSMFIMLSKELLYTMVTRAEKKMYLCAQNKALSYAINQHQITNRQTYLLEILEELNDKTKILF